LAKRGWWPVGITAVVVVALLVPAASAKSWARLQLSLIPLPKGSLGSAAHGLALAYDSGGVSNRAAADRTFGGASPTMFKKMGRISGYALHYGNEASGLPQGSLDSVWTSIDKYKSARYARRGLVFWRSDDAQLRALSGHGGLYVTNGREKVPAVGTARFANETGYIGTNIAPVGIFDEWFTEGRYLLNVRVAAAGNQARAVATKLADKLDARLKLALKGRLHGKPVKLLAKPKAGPPAGGPDLAAMTLAPSDLTGQATVVPGPGYEPGPPALSAYVLFMFPAGPFDLLGQEILWYQTPNEASFRADVEIATEEGVNGGTALDLRGAGDGAQGAIVNGPSGGQAEVVFSTGQLAEFLFVENVGRVVSTGDLTSLVHVAANKINTAYSG
jgi:hypothetical protein